MQVFYILYQYLIAFPLSILLTLFTAVTTMLFFPCKNTRWLHAIQAFWCRSCCHLVFLPVSVDGLENISPDQSYVFVANHLSTYDVFVVYGWLPNIFKWLIKKEIRYIPFVGTACKAAGHIFVDRKNIRSGAKSILAAEKALQGGVSTVIFPEGTRSENGEVGPFKRGAFHIAHQLNLPVVPISLTGLLEVMPKGAWYVHRHPVHMHIGKPINLKDYQEENEAMEAVRQAVIEGCTKH